MKIVTMAAAGTMESSDAMITIEPNDHGIELTVDSAVEKQFGPEIRRVVLDTLAEMGVEDAIVTVIDKGALNCTLRARTQAAICRVTERSWNLNCYNEKSAPFHNPRCINLFRRHQPQSKESVPAV